MKIYTILPIPSKAVSHTTSKVTARNLQEKFLSAAAALWDESYMRRFGQTSFFYVMTVGFSGIAKSPFYVFPSIQFGERTSK